MSPRHLSLIVLLLTTLPVFPQRSGSRRPGMTRGTDLSIHIVQADNQPLPDTQFRVQLLNAGQAPVREQFTATNGETTFLGLPPGMYRVRVTSPGIEETGSGDIEISGYESTHSEFIRVQPASHGSVRSPGGAVSAKSLAVPEKAKKELQKGNNAVKKQDWNEAERQYRKTIDDFPQFALAYDNLGVVCMQRKDYACARSAWEKATSLDPGSAQGFLNLGRLHMAENSLPAAEQALQRGLSLEPLNVLGMALMADVEFLMGKYDQAVMYAHKVHTVPHQAYAVAHLIAGDSLAAQKKFTEAAAEYRTLLREAPEGPAANGARAGLRRLGETPADPGMARSGGKNP